MNHKKDFWREFSNYNLGYVLEQYQRYQQNPQSVDEGTRRLFDRWGTPMLDGLPKTALEKADSRYLMGTANFAQAIRSRGYLAAQLDPLGSEPPGDPALSVEFHSLSRADLARLPSDLIQGPAADRAENAWQAVQNLREIYTSVIGYDYSHINQPEERNWLQDAAERGRFRHPGMTDSQKLLARLTEVEVFEHFLHRIYPGKTRFSIEGLDMLVPMLDEIVADAARQEICLLLLGMAHRGRLNVLAHVLGKPYTQILAEFKDPLSRFPTWDELGWTGDVKYHKGEHRALERDETIELVIRMPPNPSHLEHINPVILGMARSADSGVDQPGLPEFFPKGSLPILIHGDAAFTGEGVVAETLNMHHLPGYRVGGTLHIIANNQLGFTAEAHELRSSYFASDLAKGYDIPIIHVNADHPEACLEAVRTALAYRLRFGKDFVIDLIGYRRYGHNEGDEPAFTQPQMYQKIKQHPTVRALWAKKLIEDGEISAAKSENLIQDRMEALQRINQSLEAEDDLLEPYPGTPPSGAAQTVETGVQLDELHRLNQTLMQIPDGFNLNRKLVQAMKRRRHILEEPNEPAIDWATAEDLALATILLDGIPVRFTGEDVVRGTFSQRHAVFYDSELNGHTYTPLHNLPDAAAFEIHNSPLTENAAVGYEYGYNIQSPGRLVIWEAQYGDFVNLAQIMIDEFVVSARAKWGQTPSLVMLLPHGNEGQGPDHSSGRLERFLQLAAETNLRIANPTTAGQYFHLLRRQAALLETDPLPLIVFTPKGLLRHPQTRVSPRVLAEGQWQPVIDDVLLQDQAVKIRRLLLCSGRVYVDLVTSEMREKAKEIAIVRLEQLYRFPKEPLRKVLDGYPNLEEIDWVQEEPQNMGAWRFVQPELSDLIGDRCPLHYIGRPPSSSPAEGSTHWYRTTQQTLIERAFEHSPESDLITSEVIKERD